jgi:hypothetical protein
LLPVLFWPSGMVFLECMEFVRDLSRDIDVTDGELNQVNERPHSPESAGSVLDDADDPIEALGDGIG